jgi:hypothetical protein
MEGNEGLARADGRFMSYFGDVHPSYFGNVVKAIGSAKQGYPVVSRVSKGGPGLGSLRCRVRGAVERRAARDRSRGRAPDTLIVEVVVRAPLAARRFRPGQFYRLQNFETLAPAGEGTRLAMEGIALTGAWVDRERGLISTIVLEMGGSSDLCLELKRGEPVILMGPTGTPTEIPTGETVVLAGGGLGNAVLFSIGQAMRRAGNRVLYFAAYKHMADRYKIPRSKRRPMRPWCCDEEPSSRPIVRVTVRSSATSCRLCASRERGAGRAGDPVPGRRPHHRDRLRPHDGGGARARGDC